MSKALEAERLLKEANLVWDNNEICADKIAAAYDKAVKAASKGDSVIGRAHAEKAVMYFVKSSKADPKTQPKLIQKALKASTEAAKDPACLLGTYAHAKIRLKLGQTTEEEIGPIVRHIKEAEATTWQDHYAHLLILNNECGSAGKLVRLKEIVQINGFKDDFRVHLNLATAAAQEENYELAAQHNKIAVTLEPRLLNGHYELSVCYGALANVDDQEIREAFLQKKKEALIGYREARAKVGYKEDEAGIANLSSVLFSLGEHEQDFALSVTAVKLFGSKAAWPRVNLGLAYSHKPYSSEAERGKYEKLSRAEFKKAHKLKPGSPHTNVCEADALANFGKIAEAVAKLNDAQILMSRPEAKAEAEEMPNVQEFIRTMLEEGKQELIAKVKALGEQKDVDAISLSGTGDDIAQALREDYNAQVEKSNKKAHELVQAGINAVRDGAQVEAVTSQAELQYSYRIQINEGKSKILDVEKGIAALRSDEAMYGYFHGFYSTLRSAFASSEIAAGGKFEPDLSNSVSKASVLFSLLPFGGTFAQEFVSGVAETVVKSKIIKKMANLYGVCTDFEFGPMVAAIGLKVTYAKQASLHDQQAQITTRFGKFKAALKKLVTSGPEDKFYKSAEELEGHKDASAVLKELYNGDEGLLAATPRSTFEQRFEKFSIEHVGANSEKFGENFIEMVETAVIGCVGAAVHMM